MKILFIEDTFLYNQGQEKIDEEIAIKIKYGVAPEVATKQTLDKLGHLQALKDGIFHIDTFGEYLKIPVVGKVCRNYEDAAKELGEIDEYDYTIIDFNLPGSENALKKLREIAGEIKCRANHGPYGLVIFKELTEMGKQNIAFFTTDYGHAKDAFEILTNSGMVSKNEVEKIIAEFVSKYEYNECNLGWKDWKKSNDILISSSCKIMMGAKLRSEAWISLIKILEKISCH